MADGFVDEALGAEPGAGAGVERADFGGGVALGEACAEQGLEEMVVAEPGALVVECDEEEVGAAAVAQEVIAGEPGAVDGLHGVDERCAEAVEERGLQQAVGLGLGQAGQDLGE